MRLYLVLFPFLFLLQNNLWSWQTTTTMTKIEIKEQLATKQLALETLLKENNLSARKALNAEQLAVLEQTYTLLGIAEAPEDIGKGAFVKRVQAWINGFKAIVGGFVEDETLLNVKALKNDLYPKMVSGEFPISLILWKYIDVALAAINKEEVTVIELREAFLKGFESFDKDLSSEKSKLRQVFKTNKAAYQAITKANLEEQIMSSKEFEAWLAGAIKTANEKKQKEQEKKQKEQEKLRRDYQQVVVDYTVLFARDINSIKVNNPKNLSDTVNMDMKLFFKNLSAALDDDGCRHAPLSQNLWTFVEDNLSSDPYYEIDHVRNQFNRWCRSVSNKSPWYEDQFEFWAESRGGFPNPSLIASAMNDAYIDIDADTIQMHLIEWTKSVKDAFVMPKNYTIILEKAKTNFKELFEEESNKGISTLFFYNDILEGLFQQNGEKVNLEQLKNTVWEKAMKEIVEEQRVANYFGEWRKIYGPYAVKSFNEELDTLLPTTEEIQQALLKSIERKRKLIIPEIEIDSLRMNFVIDSEKLGVYRVKKTIMIDLTYKNYAILKDKTLMDVFTIVPTKVDVKDKSGKNSKTEIQLVRSKIKNTSLNNSGSSETVIKMTFMVVTDVEKLFGSIDMKYLRSEGHDLGYLLKKLSLDISKKGVGVSIGIEDFIYENSNVEYMTIEFTLRGVLLEGDNKIIELQTGLTSKTSGFNVYFEDKSAFISGKTFFRPPYDYE